MNVVAGAGFVIFGLAGVSAGTEFTTNFAGAVLIACGLYLVVTANGMPELE